MTVLFMEKNRSNQEVYTDDSIMSVMSIVHSTSVDGVGLRNALYTAGCNLRCANCHNRESWNIETGTWQPLEEVYNQLNIDFFPISILGGEPMMQSHAVTALCKMIKERTGKNIWVWTGHTYDYVQVNYPELLNYIDVLVDGRYVEDLHDESLLWRGSSNQRVIDIPKTILAGKVVCLDD